MEADAYAAFWDLVRFDGMGGVSLPYESTVAWFADHATPRRDREVYRRLWRSLLAGVGKDRSERAKRDEAERERRQPSRSRRGR